MTSQRRRVAGRIPSSSMLGGGWNANEEGIHGGECHFLLRWRFSHGKLTLVHGGSLEEGGGGREWGEEQSMQRDGGRVNNTGDVKQSWLIWDELNTSIIPNSKIYFHS